jgi:leucyl aminopeptidase
MPTPEIKFSFSTEGFTERRNDVLLVPSFTTPSTKRRGRPAKKDADAGKKPTLLMTPHLQTLDDAYSLNLRRVAREEGFNGSAGSHLMIRPQSDNAAAKRIILVGLGTENKLSLQSATKAYSKAFAIISQYSNLGNVGVVTPPLDNMTGVQWAHVITDVATCAIYRSEEALKPGPEIARIVLFSEKLPSVTLRKALKDAVIFAEAKCLAKDLVNKPSNQKTPETFVNLAKTIAKASTIKATIKTDVEWIEKNMPCFFEVARGSVVDQPPRFIHLNYTPKGEGGTRGRRRRNLKKLAFVGKTVVFDTGGYQVKTGNYMNTMKGDMTGGASVLAAIQAIAKLGLNIEVDAYLAATPNKIDANAMIPDSIVDTTCGKKVEIRHTDAEGRLTLIDAVAMAVKEEPEQLITVATLTGSAGIAVGQSIALMANEDGSELRDKVEQAARFLGEPIQTLDVTDGDFENIQSSLDGADIRNTQKGKGRGAQTAGAFVMSGAPEGLPMAHLDIAGGDFTDDEKATGIAVRSLIQYAMNEAN